MTLMQEQSVFEKRGENTQIIEGLFSVVMVANRTDKWSAASRRTRRQTRRRRFL